MKYQVVQDLHFPTHRNADGVPVRVIELPDTAVGGGVLANIDGYTLIPREQRATAGAECQAAKAAADVKLARAIVASVDLKALEAAIGIVEGEDWKVPYASALRKFKACAPAWEHMRASEAKTFAEYWRTDELPDWKMMLVKEIAPELAPAASAACVAVDAGESAVDTAMMEHALGVMVTPAERVELSEVAP